LDNAAIPAKSTIVGARLTAFAIVTGVVATITTCILATNALAFNAEVTAGALISIITGHIRERSVDASTISITGIISAVIAIVAARGRSKALPVDADISVGAGVTVITNHAIQFTFNFARPGSRITLAYLALPKTISNANHHRGGVYCTYVLKTGQGTVAQVTIFKARTVHIRLAVTHIGTGNTVAGLANVTHGTRRPVRAASIQRHQRTLACRGIALVFQAITVFAAVTEHFHGTCHRAKSIDTVHFRVVA